ncbi:MAG: hypothetical protein ACM3PY_11285 [Omnitrophica WOR_2 bacterium]
MNILPNHSMFGIAVGILSGLILFTFVVKSPYILGISVIVGIYLAKPYTYTREAINGAIISGALILYLLISGSLPVWPGAGLPGLLLNLLVAVAFGAVYGAVFVWVWKRLKEGWSFFS